MQRREASQGGGRMGMGGRPRGWGWGAYNNEKNNEDMNENTGPKLAWIYTKKAEHPSRVKTGSQWKTCVFPREPRGPRTTPELQAPLNLVPLTAGTRP